MTLEHKFIILIIKTQKLNTFLIRKYTQTVFTLPLPHFFPQIRLTTFHSTREELCYSKEGKSEKFSDRQEHRTMLLIVLLYYRKIIRQFGASFDSDDATAKK